MRLHFRLHLTFALLTIILLIVTLRYHHHKRFAFKDVVELAEQLSKQKYNPHDRDIPKELKAISQDQLGAIQWKDQWTIWRKQGLPFQIRLWHLGGAFATKSVKVNTMDNRGAHPLAYSPSFFDFGPNHFSEAALHGLQYAGFWIFYPLNKPNEPSELGSFKGGTYFRMLGQNQAYGLSARGIAINTIVDDIEEEFPDFTEFWLKEPASNATEMTIYALMDGPSVTGAYSFQIHPGSDTVVDIQASLFFRQKVERLGLFAFSSMYLYGENSREHFGDTIHPEVHDSDGLLIENGKGEWLWRPLQQRVYFDVHPPVRIPQKYAFLDENPHGFGLLQRDRDFQHYQDLDKKYNIRPSVWVEPHTLLGKGAVELSQLPSDNINTDNVVAFWEPEKKPLPGERVDLNYSIHWFMNDATRPPLAYVRQTLVNFPIKKPPTPAHVYLDFVGNGIETATLNPLTDLDLSSLPPGAISEPKLEKNTFDNSWRVSFAVTPNADVTELRCRLLRKGQPISETWSYAWYPPPLP